MSFLAVIMFMSYLIDALMSDDDDDDDDDDDEKVRPGYGQHAVYHKLLLSQTFPKLHYINRL